MFKEATLEMGTDKDLVFRKRETKVATPLRGQPKRYEVRTFVNLSRLSRDQERPFDVLIADTADTFHPAYNPRSLFAQGIPFVVPFLKEIVSEQVTKMLRSPKPRTNGYRSISV